MSSTTAAKLNMEYTKFPTVMLAKLPQGEQQKDGAVNFVPITGGRRYTANQLGILAITHKFRSTYSSYAKLPHYVYERELGISHATVNRNLKELKKNKVLIQKENVSDYYIDPKLKFSEKNYIIVYNFLNEKISLGRTEKKLTFNAVLLLSFMLNHYFEVKKAAKEKDGRNNIKPEEAYFIGGKQRLATLLNVAESTANDAVWELMNTGAIYRKAYYINDQCKDVVIEGKGNSRSLQTCYILNSKLIRMAERVHARLDVARDRKIARADKQAQKEERQKAKEQKVAHKKKSTKAEQRKREFDILKSLYDPAEGEPSDHISKIWRADLYNVKPKPPEPFDEFEPNPDDKIIK